MKIKKENRCCGNCGHYDSAGRMAYNINHRGVTAMCRHMLVLKDCDKVCEAWKEVEDNNIKRGQ